MAKLIYVNLEDIYVGRSAYNSPQLDRDIKTLCDSLLTVGLLNPIQIESFARSPYKIIDGHKRIIAFKKLNAKGLLPRSLSKVPCFVQDAHDNIAANAEQAPILLTHAELSIRVLQRVASGEPLHYIAEMLFCSRAIIDQIITLQSLHSKVFEAFLSGAINFEQSLCFATLANKTAQYSLMLKLGPFADKDQIMQAIRGGAKVVDLPCGDILIMPSQAPIQPFRAQPVTSHNHQIAA